MADGTTGMHAIFEPGWTWEADEKPLLGSPDSCPMRHTGYCISGKLVVRMIDTGIGPEHPSLADPDPKGKPYTVPPGNRACAFSGGANPGAPFACNGKLIGAYRFMTAYDACTGCSHPVDDFSSARDGTGHGTHTATTAAGSRRRTRRRAGRGGYPSRAGEPGVALLAERGHAFGKVGRARCERLEVALEFERFCERRLERRVQQPFRQPE